jgi:hypothetical protein
MQQEGLMMAEDDPRKAMNTFMMDALKDGQLASLPGAVGFVDEIKELIDGLAGAGVEQTPALPESLNQLMQMSALGQQMLDADQTGDPDLVMQIAEQFSTVPGMPEFAQDTSDPDVQAVFDAIDDCEVDVLARVCCGIDLNQGHGTYHKTPLYAAMSGMPPSADVINFLLDQGADPNLGLIGDSTPLHGAAFTHFHGWSVAQLTSLIKKFQSLGADIEAATTSYGWTPLHASIMERNDLLLEALLICGADPNVRLGAQSMPEFTPGSSPLHQTIYSPSRAKLLLLHGADVLAVDRNGETVGACIARKLAEDDVYARPELEETLACIEAWRA